MTSQRPGENETCLQSLLRRPLFTSVDALHAHPELFHDPQRSVSDNAGPFVIIHDNFYPDPYAIREIALQQEYFQYKPPLPEPSAENVVARQDTPAPVWMSSSLLRYFGKTVADPQPGYRHATAEVRHRLAGIVGEHIDTDTWDDAGDWWNGAFHLQYDTKGKDHGAIHHHYKDGDVVPRGWSGLVYLSPNPSPGSGTTIWRERQTGLCIAAKGARFERALEKFDLVLLVENRFNRLVLFRENVLHRAVQGFGTDPETGRLTQTFFFRARHCQYRP